MHINVSIHNLSQSDAYCLFYTKGSIHLDSYCNTAPLTCMTAAKCISMYLIRRKCQKPMEKELLHVSIEFTSVKKEISFRSAHTLP